MTTYIVTSKATGQEVYRYAADAPIPWDGFSFTEYEHTADTTPAPPPVTKFEGRRILTKGEFRSLFPKAKLKLIDRFEVQFEAANYLTDDQKDDIRTAFADYNAANEVNLDDERWAPGLGLYVTLGILTAQEVSEVLNG